MISVGVAADATFQGRWYFPQGFVPQCDERLARWLRLARVQRHSIGQDDRFKARSIDWIVLAEQLQPQSACQKISPIERELEVLVSRGRDGDQLERFDERRNQQFPRLSRNQRSTQ